jgi:hypothetical protein
MIRFRLSGSAFRAFAVLVLFCFVLSSVGADFLWFKTRDPVSDVQKVLGNKLSEEEVALVGIVMGYFALKYGYAVNGVPLKDANKRMKDEEYKHAIDQAAKICRNDAAKGFFRMGKAGEKLLKAIIQTVEDAAKAAGGYIEKKSEEYDKKK